jgi:hypothetical protein
MRAWSATSNPTHIITPSEEPAVLAVPEAVAEALGVFDEFVPRVVVEQASADGHVPAVVPYAKVLLLVDAAVVGVVGALFGGGFGVDVEEGLTADLALQEYIFLLIIESRMGA